MKKIYQFISTNNQSLQVEEAQASPDEVIVKMSCDGDEFILPFQREEFNELCNLRYRLDFPMVSVESRL